MLAKTKKGFTLIEILIVVSILGLLVTMLYTVISGSQKKARDFKRKKDLRQIQAVLALFINDSGNYPPELACCDSSRGLADCGCTTPAGAGGYWQPDGLGSISSSLMSRVPIDPLNKNDFVYYYEPVGDQTQFGVNCGTSMCAYILSTRLEDTNDFEVNPGCNQCAPTHNFCVGSSNVVFGSPC